MPRYSLLEIVVSFHQTAYARQERFVGGPGILEAGEQLDVGVADLVFQTCALLFEVRIMPPGQDDLLISQLESASQTVAVLLTIPVSSPVSDSATVSPVSEPARELVVAVLPGIPAPAASAPAISSLHSPLQ